MSVYNGCKEFLLLNVERRIHLVKGPTVLCIQVLQVLLLEQVVANELWPNDQHVLPVLAYPAALALSPVVPVLDLQVAQEPLVNKDVINQNVLRLGVVLVRQIITFVPILLLYLFLLKLIFRSNSWNCILSMETGLVRLHMALEYFVVVTRLLYFKNSPNFCECLDI